MLENEIKFIASDREFVEVWPHPKPSSRFIPEDYKKLEKFNHGNMHDETIKGCIPFLDSLTAGYIIPFDQDYLIDPADETFTITPANREQQDTPKSLREKVTSPGGTTQSALQTFKDHGMDEAFRLGIKNAFLRSKELSQEFGN